MSQARYKVGAKYLVSPDGSEAFPYTPMAEELSKWLPRTAIKSGNEIEDVFGNLYYDRPEDKRAAVGRTIDATPVVKPQARPPLPRPPVPEEPLPDPSGLSSILDELKS